MKRNILFITTDQQRYDALGCNGGTIARTPVVDRLAEEGIIYRQYWANNTLCMPARSTLLTGQHPRTHGVFSNGVPLPDDAPIVAAILHDAGYRTALIGKAHFEPGLDPEARFPEHRMPLEGKTGPLRGFEHAELALHTAQGLPGQTLGHYGRWLAENHPEHLSSYASALMAEPGGETGAPETKINPIPREWYHTDWIADRVIAWLDSVGDEEPFFVWMSFPDPHHPWDPPSSERYRVNWRDLDLPPGWLDREEQQTVLADRPNHWLAYARGEWINAEGAPWTFRPTQLTPNMAREINAMAHVMNELIDEAVGRVLAAIKARGWEQRTDVIFTTDHGELQGDFGFVFKGPFHCPALMHLPLIWKPAPAASIAAAEIEDIVSQVDIAPTLCAIAGIPVPDTMQGRPLPTSSGKGGGERAICTWDSQLSGYGMHFASLVRDGWLCTVYEASTVGVPTGVEDFFKKYGLGSGPSSWVVYGGAEGELYDLTEDPLLRHNRWDDPSLQSWRDDLVDDLRANLPAWRKPLLKVAAPT